MMKDAKLPRFLWQCMASMAAYLHNRSPSRPLKEITPFEKVYGYKPDLSHLRVPGCRAYSHVPKETRRGKLIDRAKLAILVRYDESSSIYKLYDLVKRLVYCS